MSGARCAAFIFRAASACAVDRKPLWAGAVALSAAVSFAAGVGYGPPLASIESHYDLDRMTWALFREMRESGTYLTHDNYMVLMSANRNDSTIILFPNNRENGTTGGRGWSLEGETFTSNHPNGSRFYRSMDPDGHVLKEIALHDQRDKMFMAVLTDHRGRYLTDREREEIFTEFFPDPGGRADPPAGIGRAGDRAGSGGGDPGPGEGRPAVEGARDLYGAAAGRGAGGESAGLYPGAYEVAALLAKRDDLAGAGDRTPQQERFYQWAFARYSVPNSTESIDRRLADIAGGAGRGLLERLAERVESGVDAGFVPEDLDAVDGEFWSWARLSAYCDADPGCDLDVGAMADSVAAREAGQ